MAVAEEHIATSTVARRWERAESERDALLRLARRRGLSHDDAEDCVQEAILRVVPRDDLDEERMGALLSTVVTRTAIDLHRRSATASRAVLRLSTRTEAVVERDPESVVCDRDEARWSARIVDRLPAQQRRALLARADGAAVNDIAAEMSTSAKAIESLISRARAATRSAMGSSLAAVFGLMRRWRAVSVGVGATTATAGAAIVILTSPFLGDGGGSVGGAPAHPAATGAARAVLASTSPATPLSGHAPSQDASHATGRGGDHGSPPGGRGGNGAASTPPTTIVAVAGAGVTKKETEESQLEIAMTCVRQQGYYAELSPGSGSSLYRLNIGCRAAGADG